MTDLRTAAQQALAFTMRDFASLRDFEAAKAVLHDNLRAALAQQAEPVEPMAWVLDGTSVVEFYREPYHNGPEWTPLCKCADTPPQRKPLTEEEIYRIHKDLCNTVGGSYKTMARAVEAAHGIKE